MLIHELKERFKVETNNCLELNNRENANLKGEKAKAVLGRSL